jgi:two-component system, OmpR family, phosphate regulon sensor histidine kinase PhoR
MTVKKLHIARALMIVTILLIAAFQAYWLTRLYKDESAGLQKETDVLFRETVYKMQVARFKNDTMIFQGQPDANLFNLEAINAIRKKASETKSGDTTKIIIKFDAPPVVREVGDSIIADGVNVFVPRQPDPQRTSRIFYRKSFNDSVPPAELDSLYKVVRQRMVLHNREADTARSIIINEGADRTGIINRTPPVVRKVSRNIRATGKPAVKGPGKEFRVFSTTSLGDSISIPHLDSAYKKDLQKAGIKLPFSIIQHASKAAIKTDSNQVATTPVPVGIIRPVFYQATFSGVGPYITKQIAPQILLSLILVAFTMVTFVFLYRNLLAQQRLAEMKNDFISNITHELKTPIATVTVAIEAMKNFNALHNPERTQEYLDISSAELQRLSLLVDKVLRLSMFEKKEIELRKEDFDLAQLVQEVIRSMRLQFDKCAAVVELHTDGNDFYLNADRLHIMSVVYNLLDNALKYCRQDLRVDIDISVEGNEILLAIKDNGMGIEQAFQSKIFDKFFRVPAHDTHNIKGYGLGLSYVAHIVQQHHGSIKLESQPGVGSKFTVRLPKQV